MPGRGVLRPTLAEPELVPMTQDQHDQAVAALATMICDWLRTRPAADTPDNADDPAGPSPQESGNES
jgi:hypothetical protein